MDIKLQPGDLFLTRNPQALGRAINAAQTFWSKDGKSTYSHAGIILDEKGTTFEALWTIKRQNLFEAYAGEKVCIARWDGMKARIAKDALAELMREHEGKAYPAWRLLFQIVPPIAKYTSWGGKFAVCSELVAKFLYIIYRQCVGEWFLYLDKYDYKWPRHEHFCGCNPDMLSDEWHRWEGYKIVFEGILEVQKCTNCKGTGKQIFHGHFESVVGDCNFRNGTGKRSEQDKWFARMIPPPGPPRQKGGL